MDRVSGKKEIVRLLEEGWWLDYFWAGDYHSSAGLYIHCDRDTKKVIGDAKFHVCQMLNDGLLIDDEDSQGTPTLRGMLEDDDFLFV